jgi:hypothetical protein
MSNLFSGWPKDQLAIVDLDLDDHDKSICVNRFQIRRNSRPTAPQPLSTSMGWRRTLVTKLGLSSGIKPIVITQELRNFIREFRPDIIYTQASQLALINLSLQLQTLTRASITFHVMDDFRFTAHRQGLLGWLLHRIFRHRLKVLVDVSSCNLVISASMAEEFSKYYKKPFFPFHNPVAWGQLHAANLSEQPSLSLSNPVRFCYSGRLGIGVTQTLIQLCEIFRQLNSQKVRFELTFSINPNQIDLATSSFSRFQNESWLRIHAAPTGLLELVRFLRTNHALLHPVDFDNESVRYLRHSMPTKLPLYFATGVPVLAIGPSTVYSIELCKRNEMAVICTSADHGDIARTVESFEDVDVYQNYFDRARRAMRYCEENFDDKVVRNNFLNTIAAALVR